MLQSILLFATSDHYLNSDYINNIPLSEMMGSIVIDIDGEFCEDECYIFREIEYCEPGTFTVPGEQSEECDTIYRLTLIENLDKTNEISVTICEDEVLYIAGIEINTEGQQTIVIPSESKCDSIIYLDLQYENCNISQGFNTRANPKCFNSYDGEYLFEIVNGTPPFSYEVVGLNVGLVETGVIDRLNELTVLENLRADTYMIHISNNYDGVGLINFRLENPQRIDPGIIISDFSDANVSCFDSNDGRIELNPAGGFPDYTIRWSNGSNQSYLENLNSGLYHVTITDLALCEIPLQIEIVAPLPITQTVLTSNPNCEDTDSGSILHMAFGGTPPYSYILNSDIENSEGIFDEIEADEYFLEIMDANGCQLDTSILLREPYIPEVTIEGDSILCLGENIELNAIINDIPIKSIEWNRVDSLLGMDSLQQIVYPVNDFTYTLTVSSIDDCMTSVSHPILINSSLKYYAPNIFNPKGQEADQIFRIIGSKEVSSIRNLKVIDRWGQVVYENNDLADSDGWDGKVNGAYAKTGTYLWKAEIEFLDGRLIVEHGSISLIH